MKRKEYMNTACTEKNSQAETIFIAIHRRHSGRTAVKQALTVHIK